MFNNKAYVSKYIFKTNHYIVKLDKPTIKLGMLDKTRYHSV